MARTRQLKPDFFLHETLALRSPLARLLFGGLWVLADREGRLEDRPARIKAQIFPYHEADMESLLGELNGEFIARYKVKGGAYIEVLNFKKHQHIHPDEKTSVIPKNQEITGDFKTHSEITPFSSSPSPSPSPSPSTSPSPIKQPATTPSAVDFSDYRLPKGFGEYGGCYVTNVPAESCQFLINQMKPGPKVRAALQWRMAVKMNESAGMSKIPAIHKASA